MALAGRRHVIVAAQAHAAGPAGHPCGQGRDGGNDRRLALLAAERATHAADFHVDIVVAAAQHLGDVDLDFCGVLGGGMDHHFRPFPRHGIRDMAFEVKVILPANLQPSLEAVLRRSIGTLEIPVLEMLCRVGVVAPRKSLLDVENRNLLRNVQHDQAGRLEGGGEGVGDHSGNNLADMLHFVIGQHRLVLQDRRGLVFTGYVAVGQHRLHAGQCKCRPGVDGCDRAPGHRRQHGRDVQCARQRRHIVDINRLSAHVAQGAVMGIPLAHHGALHAVGLVGTVGGERRFLMNVHNAITSTTSPACSATRRCSRLPATRAR